MKSIYELRYGNEIVASFPTEYKAVKALNIYIDYLKVNNGIEVDNQPPRIDKYSMVNMSNGLRLFILEREYFQTMKEFKRYMGL